MSVAFTAILHREKVAVSMDGKGRSRDNVFVERLGRSVKYEELYLNAYFGLPGTCRIRFIIEAEYPSTDAVSGSGNDRVFGQYTGAA